MQITADAITGGWQYPAITRGKVIFKNKVFVSEPFTETQWVQRCPIKLNNQVEGSVEVYYLEGRMEEDEGPFLKEEKDLINGIATMLGETISKRHSEEALQTLNKQLEHRVQERTEELHRSSERLKLATTAANIGIWENVTNENYSIWSDEMFSIYGLKKQKQVLHSTSHKLILSEDLPILEEALKKCSEDKITTNVSYRIKHPQTNQIKYISSFATPVLDNNNNKVKRIIGVNLDVTQHREMEEALEREKNRLQLFLDNSPIPVGITTGSKLKYCNKVFLNLFGKKKGDSIIDIYKNIEDRDKMLKEIGVNGELLNYEIQMLDKTKNICNINANYFPITFDNSPSLLFWMVDITSLKKTEETLKTSKESADRIVDSSPVPMTVIIDETEEIVRVNQAMANLINSSIGELYQHDTPELCDKLNIDRKTLSKILKEKGRIDNYELRMNCFHSGSKLWVLLSSQPLIYEGKKALITTIINISDIKRIQNDLQKARDIAEAATLAKSQFLATMSHEIRTPMNAIIGLSKLALRTDLNKKQENYISQVESNSLSLLRIINDILDFSKIEAGKLGIEKTIIKLDDIMNIVANLNAYKAQQKGIEFLVQIDRNIPAALIGDQLRITQVLSNFCSNAIKFTEKGEILLQAKLISKSNSAAKIEFSVKDSGIGLTETQKGKIFKSFTQADQTTTRKHGGTGLGLTICQSLASLMNGDIHFQSEENKGSTFYFTLQLGIKDPYTGSSLVLPRDLQGMKVLICDDNAYSRKQLTDTLEILSCRAQTTCNSDEVISLFNKETNDPCRILLLDYDIPSKDGLSIYKEIQQKFSLKIPVLVMINMYHEEETRAELNKYGVKNYITKPITCSKLFESIIDVFGKNKSSLRGGTTKKIDLDNKLLHIQGAKILLVEDIAVNRQIARDFLENAGFNVSTEKDGLKAVTRIQRNDKFDLVLMDLQMPVMNGYTATQKIRKLKTASELPIIAMTADAMVGVKEKCLEAGMQGMVTKPIDPAVLFNTLVKWLNPGLANKKINKQTIQQSENILLSLSGLDLESTMPRFNYKTDRYLTAFNNFYKTFNGFCAQMEELIDENKTDDACKLVHSLKGVSANLGATVIQSLAIKIEQQLMKSNSQKSRFYLRKMDKALQRIFKEFLILTQNNDPDTENDKLDIKEVFAELRKFISQNNPKAKELAMSLRAKQLNQILVNKLNDTLARYNFKAAFTILDDLESSINQ